eukprot:2935608-Pyramimonas_sp.AAC.1
MLKKAGLRAAQPRGMQRVRKHKHTEGGKANGQERGEARRASWEGGPGSHRAPTGLRRFLQEISEPGGTTLVTLVPPCCRR